MPDGAAPTFPSADWIDAYCLELMRHPRSHETAVALEGTYRFVIEPTGPVDRRHVYDVHVRPAADGADVTRVDIATEPRLVLTAGYDRWRQLIERRLDVGLAVLTRRLRLSGDLGGIRGSLQDAKPLLDALSSVDTRWPE
jgi:hypothetical protein